MNLYSVTFRSDVYFGKELKSNHRIVLTADTTQQAEVYARWFFQHHGKWSRAANLTDQDLLSEPRIRDLKIGEIRKLVVYEQQVSVDGEIPNPARENG